MTIVPMLEELEGWLRSNVLKQAVQARRLGTAAGAVTATLKDKKHTFELLEQLAEASPDVVRSNHHLRAEIRTSASAIRNHGQALRAASDRVALHDWNRNEFVNLERTVQRLSADLKRGWSERCQETFEVDRKLADLLCRFPSTKTLGEEMRTAATEGLGLKEDFPPSKKTRNKLDKLATDCAAHRAELAKSGLTEEVVQLLLAAVDGNATLANVTPESFKWLEAQGALGHLKVRL